MTLHPTLFRLISLAVALSLTLAPAASFAGIAPSLAPQPGDPPARVGRLAQINGTVSFHTADEDHWEPATLNYPVTSGNAFWTEPGAQAEIETAGTRLVMAEQTELDLDTLDEKSLIATEPQGEVYLRVRRLADGETDVVQTPRGVVTIRTPGRYAVVAGDTEHPTTVTVLEGTAEIAADNLSQQVGANQMAVITGNENFQAKIEPAQPDAFVTALLEAERKIARPAPRPKPVAPPVVVAEMSGGEDLANYGEWQSSPQYGTVWYPEVASGWVPYREGHWAYVEPWGWTWVDAAPWGFAPFHYGRWVAIDGRWAWVPAEYTVAEAPPPIYAPALVSFFEPGAAVATGVAVGALGALAVGWLPLGPREVYRPWYHSSPNYLRGVNARLVPNVTTISNTRITNVTVNNYVNRVAATAVPAAAMAASRPIAAVARPIPTAQLGHARPVIGRVPVAPTTATAGISPGLAGRLHLKPPPAGVAAPARPPAPGPAITAGAFHPGAVRPHNPALRGAAVNGTVPNGTAPVPRAPHPGPAGRSPLPPLATPGLHAAPTAPGSAPGPAIVHHAPGTVTNAAPRPVPPAVAHAPPAAGEHGSTHTAGHPPAIATPAHPSATVPPRGPAEPHPRPPPQANLRQAPPREFNRPAEPTHPPQHLAPSAPQAIHQPSPTPAFHPPAAPAHPAPPALAMHPPQAPSFHPPPVAAPAPARPPAEIARPTPPSFHPPAPAAPPVMRAPEPHQAPPSRSEDRRHQPQ
ncbi:MAG: FecR domain-containing protein [Alphaproteobacteria bacterium]|nr:FecR domain-containing protein [Alphaproteobacteria bacterium]